VASIEGEFRRYRALAEGAFRQLSEAQLGQLTGAGDNSVATIAWHVAGNLRSRFTDFLTGDGEKPDRDRDSEFLSRQLTHAALLAFWSGGWDLLSAALADLSDLDLARTVTIRQQPLSVTEALHRSLAHASYHVGQIVFLAKQLCGPAWVSLSIPPGQSAAYNASPTHDRPPGS
jgi:uncharacterized damage-inducible protein DinB